MYRIEEVMLAMMEPYEFFGAKSSRKAMKVRVCFGKKQTIETGSKYAVCRISVAFL